MARFTDFAAAFPYLGITSPLSDIGARRRFLSVAPLLKLPSLNAMRDAAHCVWIGLELL
jgi:hypothetical protein